MSRLSPSPGAALFVLARVGMAFASVCFVACKSDGGGVQTPPPIGDSGVRDRVAPDMPKPLNDGAVSEKMVGGDGAAQDINVTIVNPMTDQIVTLADRFVPVVDVEVTNSGGLEDEVKDVTAEVIDEKGMLVAMAKLALSMKTPSGDMVSVYRYAETPVDIAAAKSGTYNLRIKAATMAGSSAEAIQSFKGDAGPIIVVAAPMMGKPVKSSLSANVKITDPLFPPISDVVMAVGDVELIPTGPSPDGTYTATFDFSTFVPPITGPQLFKVRARNSNGTLAQKGVSFVVDNEGPIISGTTPASGALIGQVIKVQATVTDTSGVLASSVHAVVAHADDVFEIKLVAAMGASIYAADFDTRVLPKNALFPTISFRASDTLGNESAIGYPLALDNTPPLAEMRQTIFRVAKRMDGQTMCSKDAVALGADAPIDGEIVNQLFPVRARIEDYGNSVLSGPTPFAKVAGVDPATVAFYLMDDTSQALVVDTDGNGYCDAVNPNLQPTSTPMSSKDLLKLGLSKVALGGQADFTPFVSTPPECPSGTEDAPPELFCAGAFAPWKAGFSNPPPEYGMTIVPITGQSPADSALWVLPPILGDDLQCLGQPFDAYANHINDGWACLAVSMSDLQRNAQVSVPLRVCIDSDADGAECPHRRLSKVISILDQPIQFETSTPHGFATGDTVVITRSYPTPRFNGQWTVTVLNDTTFSIPALLGSGSAPQLLPSTMGGISVNFVVGLKELPDCTGTQIASGPPAEIDQSTGCTAWNEFGYTYGE